jgi:head-tail adaptor
MVCIDTFMSAGDYPDRVRILRRNATVDEIGGVHECFFYDGWLWARVEEENGRRENEYGGTQTGADGTIYIRNYPDISPLDRIEDNYGLVWRIDSIHQGDDELLATVSRDDSLTDMEFCGDSSS